MESFITYLTVERGASPHTVEAYRRDLEQFADFILREVDDSLTIHDLTHIHIRRYLAHLHRGIEKSSIGRKLAAIRSLFRFLLRRGVIERNPAELVSTPKKEKKLPYHLSVDEASDLVEAPQGRDILMLRDRAILETLYSCGLRVSRIALSRNMRMSRPCGASTRSLASSTLRW